MPVQWTNEFIFQLGLLRNKFVELTDFFLTSHLYIFSPYYTETTFHFGGSPFGVYVKCKIGNQDGTETINPE